MTATKRHKKHKEVLEDTSAFSASVWLNVLLLALFVCASCDPPHSAETHEVVQVPQRIVSISPSVTEMLYGVGAWPQVVAVSQFCSYPEDVRNKPRVNGWERTNLEQLTALKPDLVIGVEAQAPFLQDKLSELGIRSLFLKSNTLSDVYTAIDAVGKISGHEQQAAELLSKTKSEIETVRNAFALMRMQASALSASTRPISRVSERTRRVSVIADCFDSAVAIVWKNCGLDRMKATNPAFPCGAIAHSNSIQS